MAGTYQNPVYNYRKSPDQATGQTARHPVVIIGAGPIGLAAALDLAQSGQPVVVLDDNNTVSVGSRAICFAKRSLEILDRLGVGQRCVDKGITWNLGKVFHRDKLVYQFNLLPEEHHHRPAFINLQQYYLEQYLVEKAEELAPRVDLRWKNKVTAVNPQTNGVDLTVDTPDGEYQLHADWLLVADGANSDVREMMGLESKGQVFLDKFLIADLVMEADFPTERWFWFDPPFHPNQSVLLHKQADNVWRIDFQLGWDADADQEKKPENVIPRIKAMLGEDVNFELEWVSVYTFRCRKMDKFRHGRVIFMGDAAHQVSPFGARGANSGLQDTDNLSWKLRLVIDGKAPERLLDSYDHERLPAARENILNSTRSTDFITPKSNISRIFRDCTLELSEHYPFARALVNSGRLSLPSVYTKSSLNTPDSDTFGGTMVPGAPIADGPVRSTQDSRAWLLNFLGNRFRLLYFAASTEGLPVEKLQVRDGDGIPVEPVVIVPAGRGGEADFPVLEDTEGVLIERYDARAGSCYLIRPDQHVAARWREPDPTRITEALERATARR